MPVDIKSLPILPSGSAGEDASGPAPASRGGTLAGRRRRPPWVALAFVTVAMGVAGLYLLNVSAQESLAKPLVAVRITGIERDFKRFGLSEEGLRAEVIQKLQAAGYEVTELDALPAIARVVDLRLNTAYNTTAGIYSYAASVKIRYAADLRGRSDTPPLWASGATGWAKQAEITRIRDLFLKQVDRFVSENPAQ